HYSMLGAVNPRIQTPNLDRLAAEGMRFDRAYCPNPTCTPSRASIITGMYPSRHGAWSLGTKLLESVPTLGGYLLQAGYRTALVGKAHFQPLKSTEEYPSLEAPERLRDFTFWKNFNEEFYGFQTAELLRNHTAEPWVGQHYAMWMEEKGFKNWRDVFFRPAGKKLPKKMGRWDIPEAYHYNTWIAERTNALMEQYQQEGSPFFLWASFPDPHYPQLVPAPWDTMYDPEEMELPEFSFAEHAQNPPYFREVCKRFPNFKPYRETGYAVHGLQRHKYKPKELKKQLALAYGMVSYMDQAIGKILDGLKALGLEQDTLVVFTTDHGDLFGQHGLRHKCIFHYEDLLRVPLVARYPGRIQPGSQSSALQCLADLAPTFLSYCGLDCPAQMNGIDQSAVWDGSAQTARDSVIVENRHEPTVMNLRTYVDDRYKLTVHANGDYGELYDLEQDPQEHHNLWSAPQARQLKADLLVKYLQAEYRKNTVGTLEKDGQTLDTDLDGYRLHFDADGTLSVLEPGEDAGTLWGAQTPPDVKITILLHCARELLKNEPIQMPRITFA
ncbi:MAG: sulfatase-like hydrolase/transferase, partial [Clostridiales bacterium]|nr:sulfatase-like hydrolase/transferase [Clostridiales bacterium]